MPDSFAIKNLSALPLSMEKLGMELINDNSKRSVSIRINTSDFGRIKAISRRLKVRESEVFRFLVKVGLAEVSALCRSNATAEELLGAFAAHSAELVSHFNLNARRLGQVLNADSHGDGIKIDSDDLELLAMTAFPTRYLAMRLQEMLGHPVAPDAAQQTLRKYLEDKYQSSGDHPQAATDGAACG